MNQDRAGSPPSANGMSSSSPPLVPNQQHLQPQARRKRGLSLRSQLFNKSIDNQTQQPFPSSEQSPPPQGNTLNTTNGNSGYELNDFSNKTLDKNASQLFTVDESFQSTSTSNYEPYSDYNRSKSTTYLTNDPNDTQITDNSLSFHARKERALQRRYHTNNQFIRWCLSMKNLILSTNDLPPSEGGRVIPICTNHKEVNDHYGEKLYNEHAMAFIDERSGEPYVNNRITSSKYTIYSFLPKQLRAQFSKLANCYFMVVAIMQMIPKWSTTGQYTTIIPLSIFMSISIAREGFDDWKRHGHDKEENNKKTIVIKEDEELSTYDAHSIATILTETIPVIVTADTNNEEILEGSGSSNGKHSATHMYSSSSVSSLTDLGGLSSSDYFTNKEAMKRYNLKEYVTKWKHVKVGDIIKLNENDWFPADVVLIATSDRDHNEAFVETMALDGETNLKPKRPHPEIAKYTSKVTGLKNFKTSITVEDPNLDLYNFEGSFTLDDQRYSLGSDNVVYRGSILRNTKSALGVVIFTGEETKIRMNNIKHPRTKAPKLQKNINYIVLFMVFVVMCLSAFSTMAQRLLYHSTRDQAWYLYDQDAGVAATLMGFIIMYNTLIPLSLYVTMEIIKVMQLLFLQYDIDMYHVESNTPADAKTATILEELGQVSYVFSDKTGTLTDNCMVFRKFSVCGVSWLHDLDLILKHEQDPNSQHFTELVQAPRPSMHYSTNNNNNNNKKKDSAEIVGRNSTTSIARQSLELRSIMSNSTWKSTAHPKKLQTDSKSLQLLKYIQSHPDTLFTKKAKFFLLSLALCHTCLPRKTNNSSLSTKNNSTYTLDNINENQESVDDSMIDYQAASPDELALVQAARDLGYIVFSKSNSILTIKSYPKGFQNEPVYEKYEVLQVIEFSSIRKRMSVVVKFPDNRICLLCKGADNVIIERLKNAELAKQKAKEISLSSADRKTMQADLVLNARFSQDDPQGRVSMSSLAHRLSSSGSGTANIEKVNSIDNALMGREEEELADIALKARKSLHIQQAKKYSLDLMAEETSESAFNPASSADVEFIPNDKLLIQDAFLIEKTLEHIEEFSTEGLRTLMYAYRFMDETEYQTWNEDYINASTSLVDRAERVEAIGGQIEHDFELAGATAIEDKLQDGVSEAIEKLRRAGIKMWMLTGDKRETAINIGYSCRLIKDYSTVVVLSNDNGSGGLMDSITSASYEIQAGRIAHSVLVIDGSTLSDIEKDSPLLSLFIELCVQVDSTICCRASPSQKASMVSAVRNLKKDAVTLAIGDGANDIAMIQSADIGVGITGKEGLQAARSSDYAIAQFRFLLKLLLVNGRYNYVRTSKFVLCTFYKELLFYLTQCVYQRNTLFSGSSMYESWSLSMFNTLFTSLCVICIGMFDKDLKPATLIAVPELYSIGRLYQGFNLKLFVSWMLIAAIQSIGISFLAYYAWGFTALRDNSVFPLGTVVFAALVIVINTKTLFIEMQNRQWLAFAAFIISVGGYGLWNVLIMAMYRSKESPIYFVAYGLEEWGVDQSWWATLLVLFTVPLFLDVIFKILKFMFKPSDSETFKVFERDLSMRRIFEQNAYKELYQSWTFEKNSSTARSNILKAFGRNNVSSSTEGLEPNDISLYGGDATSTVSRKRAGTNPNPNELPPSGEGVALRSAYDDHLTVNEDYEILPSGKKVRIRSNSYWSMFTTNSKKSSEEALDAEISAIINERMKASDEAQISSKQV
ncbi:putative phospholipid-transporting ATPase [Scheffersomyces coipomensis]|uniref:putative phospholipid-transporting ATPase n=1 Tax=Scheffersomyces coipomensis TaxID=1788519 RepID=UPI00315C9F6D